MKRSAQPEPAPHEPVADHPSEPAAPVTAEPAPGVLAEFMAWQPNPKLAEMHANLGRSLVQMRNQIGEHLNEAVNGLQRLVIDLETLNRRDPGVAVLQQLIERLS
jgi:hypothetical protein